MYIVLNNVNVIFLKCSWLAYSNFFLFIVLPVYIKQLQRFRCQYLETAATVWLNKPSKRTARGAYKRH